jgi:hypothetical protein
MPDESCAYPSTRTVGSAAVYDYHLSPCTSDSRPACAFSPGTITLCTVAAIPTIIAYPGEKCVANGDCVSSTSTCVGSYCTGLANNSTCTATLDCSAGLYCNGTEVSTDRYCTGLMSVSAVCNVDYDCDYNLGCFSGICSPYFGQVNMSACLSGRDDECSSNACLYGLC